MPLFKNMIAGIYQAYSKVVGVMATRYGGNGWTRFRFLMPGSRYDYEKDAGDLWVNPIVGLCLDWMGNRFPRPILRVSKIKRNGDFAPVGRHPLVDLWNRPNEHYGRRTMEKAIGLSLKVDGNAYIYKVRDNGGRVCELWWVPHYRCLPTWPSDGSKYIDGYRIWLDSVVYVLPPEDIIHIRDGIDPRNERLGLCALRSNIREVCTINEESGYRSAILRNSGVPGLVVIPDEDKLRPTQADADAIRDKLWETTGGDNRGQTAVLGGKYKVEVLGFSPEQLNLVEFPVIPTARILSSMGVAPMSVGLPDPGKTYCMPASTRVWTIAGSKSIADVLPGDMVWSVVDGELVPRRVLRSAKTGHEPLVEIRTKNRTLRGTATHPVLVRKAGRLGGGGNEDRRVGTEWKRLGDLTIGDSVVQPKSLPDQGRGNFLFNPADESLTKEESDSSLLQFLGAFVGDGSMVEKHDPKNYGYSRRLVVAMPKDDRAGAHYRRLAESLFRKTDGSPVAVKERPRCFQFQSVPAFRFLRLLGFDGKAKAKRVPGWVFRLRESLRLSFLAGIVDSDGSIGKDGRLQVALCNRDLVEDIRDLCISVGIQCSNVGHLTYSPDVLPNRGTQERYDSYRFTASSAVQVARIPFADPLYRKRVADNAHRMRPDGLDASKAGLSEHLGFYEVRQIRSLPSEEVYDIEVDEGHCFIADGIVAHNSNLGEANRSSWGTIVATQELVAEALRWELLPEFGSDPQEFTTEYDYTHIQELQEALDAVHTRTREDWKAGIIKLAEARETLGYEKLEDDEDNRWFPGTGSPEEQAVQDQQHQERLAVLKSKPALNVPGQNGNLEDGKPPEKDGKKPAGNGKPVKAGEEKRWSY